jgi:hypothetical protein
MRRLFALGSAWVVLSAAAARAEHAKINLDVVAPGGQKSAFVDQTPPATGKNPRPVLRAKAGDPIKVRWVLTNVYPHKTLKDVVVHFYIAPAEKVGQKELPPLGEDVVVETAFEMDFKPGAKAGAHTTVRIQAPGVYLVRVETRQTGSDHEHFSAIDLVIEDDKDRSP